MEIVSSYRSKEIEQQSARVDAEVKRRLAAASADKQNLCAPRPSVSQGSILSKDTVRTVILNAAMRQISHKLQRQSLVFTLAVAFRPTEQRVELNCIKVHHLSLRVSLVPARNLHSLSGSTLRGRRETNTRVERGWGRRKREARARRAAHKRSTRRKFQKINEQKRYP